MSHEEKKQAILEYIASEGETTQNDVVAHMNKAPMNLRTSWLTTRALIKELEAGDRIKIIRAERQGQSHRLSINRDSQFNRFSQNLPTIEKHIEELQIPLGREADLIMWNLLAKLEIVNRLPFEKDVQILNQKILNLLLVLARKKVESTKTKTKSKSKSKR